MGGIARGGLMNDQELLYETAESNPAQLSMTTIYQEPFTEDYCRSDDVLGCFEDAIHSANQSLDLSGGSLLQDFASNLQAQSSEHQSVSDHFISQQDVLQSPDGETSGELHAYRIPLKEQVDGDEKTRENPANFESDVSKLQNSSSTVLNPSTCLETTYAVHTWNSTVEASSNSPISINSESDTYIIPCWLDESTYSTNREENCAFTKDDETCSSELGSHEEYDSEELEDEEDFIFTKGSVFYPGEEKTSRAVWCRCMYIPSWITLLILSTIVLVSGIQGPCPLGPKKVSEDVSHILHILMKSEVKSRRNYEITIYHPNFFSDASLISSVNPVAPISETEPDPASYDLHLLREYEEYQQRVKLEKEYWLSFSQLLKWSFRPQSCAPRLPEIATVCLSDDDPTAFCPLQEQTFVYDTARVRDPEFVLHSVTTEATLSPYLPNLHLAAKANNFLKEVISSIELTKGELLPVLSLLLLISLPLPSIKVSSLQLVLKMLLCRWVILICTAATLLVTYHTAYIDLNTESVLPQKLSKITKFDTNVSLMANAPSTWNVSHPSHSSVESVVTMPILQEIKVNETSMPPNFAEKCNEWCSTWIAALLDILGPTCYCLTIAFTLYTITCIHAIIFSSHVRYFLSDCYSITQVFLYQIFQLIGACIRYSKRLARSPVQWTVHCTRSPSDPDGYISSSNYKDKSFEHSRSNMDEPIDIEWFEGDASNCHRDLQQEIDSATYSKTAILSESSNNADDSSMNSLESDLHVPEPEECEPGASPMIYHDPQSGILSCPQSSSLDRTTTADHTENSSVSVPECHNNQHPEKSALEPPTLMNIYFKLQLPAKANTNVASGNTMISGSCGGDLKAQADPNAHEKPLLSEDTCCLHEVLPDVERKLLDHMSDDSVTQYKNANAITSGYFVQAKIYNCEVRTQSTGVSNMCIKMEFVVGGLSATSATSFSAMPTTNFTPAVMKLPHSTYNSLADKHNSFMEGEMVFIVFMEVFGFSRLTILVFSNKLFTNRAMALSILSQWHNIILSKFRLVNDRSITGYLKFSDADHGTDNALYIPPPEDYCAKPNITIGYINISLVHATSQMEQYLSDIGKSYDLHIRSISSTAAQSHAPVPSSTNCHSQTFVLLDPHALPTCEKLPLSTIMVQARNSSPLKHQQVQLLSSNVSTKKELILVETISPSPTNSQHVPPDVSAEEYVLSSICGREKGHSVEKWNTLAECTVISHAEFTTSTTSTLGTLCDSTGHGRLSPNSLVLHLNQLSTVQEPCTNRHHALGQKTLPYSVKTLLGKSRDMSVQSLDKHDMNATTTAATTSDVTDIQKWSDVVVLKQSDNQYELSPEPDLVDGDIQSSNYIIRSDNYGALNICTPLITLSQLQNSSTSREYPEVTTHPKNPLPSTEDLCLPNPRCLPPDKFTDSLSVTQTVDTKCLYPLNGRTISGTCVSTTVELESLIYLTQSVLRCVGKQESSIPRENESELVVGTFSCFLFSSDTHQDSQPFVELGNGSEPVTIQIGSFISINYNMLDVLTGPSSTPAEIVHETTEATTLASSIDPSNLGSCGYSSTIGLAEEDRESLTNNASSTHLLPSICREQGKGMCVYPPLPPLPSSLNPPNEPAVNIIVTSGAELPQTNNAFVDRDDEGPGDENATTLLKLMLHTSPLPAQDLAMGPNPPADQTIGAVSVSAIIGQLSNNIDVSRGTSSSKPAVSHTKKLPPLTPTCDATEAEKGISSSKSVVSDSKNPPPLVYEVTEGEQVHVRSKFTERDKPFNSDMDEETTVPSHSSSDLNLHMHVQQMPAKSIQTGSQQRPIKSLDSGFATKSSSNQPEVPTSDGIKPKQTPSAPGSATYFPGHNVTSKFGRPTSARNRLEVDSLHSGSTDTGADVKESDPCILYNFVNVNHLPTFSFEPLVNQPWTSGHMLMISTTAPSTADNPQAITSFTESFGSADSDVLSQDNSKDHMGIINAEDNSTQQVTLPICQESKWSPWTSQAVYSTPHTVPSATHQPTPPLYTLLQSHDQSEHPSLSTKTASYLKVSVQTMENDPPKELFT